MINFDEVIECLEMERKSYCDFSGCKEIQAINTAIRSLKAWKEVISEMQSRKATYPTPSKENWNKEVIARNSGIDECIEIVMKYLKGGENFG